MKIPFVNTSRIGKIINLNDDKKDSNYLQNPNSK